MEEKRNLNFNIYATIDNNTFIIANINYNKNNKYADVLIYNNLVKNLIDCNKCDWNEIIKFLESRCFSKNDKEKLKYFNIEKYDIFKIIKQTNGKRNNDIFSIKFV